eukprot:835606_1
MQKKFLDQLTYGKLTDYPIEIEQSSACAGAQFKRAKTQIKPLDRFTVVCPNQACDQGFEKRNRYNQWRRSHNNSNKCGDKQVVPTVTSWLSVRRINNPKYRPPPEPVDDTVLQCDDDDDDDDDNRDEKEEEYIKQRFIALRKALCGFIKSKVDWLNDKQRCGEIKGCVFRFLWNIIHSEYHSFTLMFDHHIHILRTETVIETLCSFLKLVFSDKRKNMLQPNLFKNTVCYVSMKQRNSEERTCITDTVNREYYEQYKRHGVITDEYTLSKRKYEDSKVIHKLDTITETSIFKVPLTDTKQTKLLND